MYSLQSNIGTQGHVRSNEGANMEKMRNKSGRIVSYREKVYVDGRAVTKTLNENPMPSVGSETFNWNSRDGSLLESTTLSPSTLSLIPTFGLR